MSDGLILDEPIHAAQFIDTYLPVMDGVIMTVRNYAAHLIKQGECCVVCPKARGYKDNEPFEVIRTNGFKIPVINYCIAFPDLDFAAKKKIHDMRIDICHAHSPFGMGGFAHKTAKKRDIPVVATFHSKYYDDFLKVTHSKLIANLAVRRVVNFYNSVDEVWACSKSTANTLREYGYKGEIGVMPNGTDMTFPANPEELVLNTNRKFALQNEERVILFVGQHIWQKNIKLIIESLRLLKNNNFKFKMVMVGTGYNEAAIKKLVNDMELMNNFIFTGPISDRDALCGLYLRADLFLFPSVYDNAPLVVREAAVNGLPSLLIKGSNAAEIVTDDYNGFLAEESPEAVAKRVVEIFSNKEFLIKTGQTAKETIPVPWSKIVGEAKMRYKEIIKIYNNAKNNRR